MKVSVNSPKFDDGFLFGLKKAIARGCTTLIDRTGDNIYIEAKSGDRVIGKYTFIIDGDECKMAKKFTIEREYYPFEVVVSDLVKFLKRKKIKFVIWE